MPKYRITSPDGGTYEVTAPDGATQDDVLAYAQENWKPKTAAQKYDAEDAARAQANEAAGPLEQFATGVKAQAGRTMLGVNEFLQNADEALPAAAKVLPVVNAVPALAAAGRELFGSDAEVLAEAQREADRTDKGTGAAGFAGNLVGDFRNLVGGGAGMNAALKANTLRQAAVQGAKVGSASGAATGLTEATGDADSDVLTNALNAAIGGGLGAALGGGVPLAAQAAVRGGGQVLRAASPFQTQGMAEAKAQATLAKLLSEKMDGAALRQAADQARSSGVPVDLAEMTQSGDVLGLRKNIAGGFGKAAGDMRDAVAARNEAGIPRAVDSLITPLIRTGEQGGQRLDRVLARAGNRPVDVAAVRNQVLAKAAKTNPENAEGRIYAAVIKELDFAEQQGGTFEALHRAKQALDKLYIEGADATLLKRANDLTSETRKGINKALQAADPDYGPANRQIQAGMAGRGIAEALSASNEGSVATFYNRVWAKPEARDELSRLLDPKDYLKLSMAMSQVKKIVKGGMGGSDTESRLMARQAMNEQTGTPLLEQAVDVSRGSLLGTAARRVSDRVRQKDLQALQRQIVSPDVDALAARIDDKGSPVLRNAAAQPLGVEATKAAVPTEQEPLRVTVTPQEQLPPVNLPPARAPQDPLINRMATAESSNDPDARNPNSTASGLLQFTDPTWKEMVLRYGKETGITLAMKDDPEAQRVMGAKYARQNLASLQKAFGRLPSKGELYMAHVLGAGGAKTLIRSKGKGTPAAALYPSNVVRANRPLFYDGKAPRSAAELYALLENKVS